MFIQYLVGTTEKNAKLQPNNTLWIVCTLKTFTQNVYHRISCDIFLSRLDLKSPSETPDIQAYEHSKFASL